MFPTLDPRTEILDQAGRAPGNRRVLAAPADLLPWVRSGWIDDHGPPPEASLARDRDGADVRAADGSAWRIVPDASAYLVYARPRTRGRGRLALVGPRSTFVDTDLSRRRLTVGIRLRAGAVAALVDAPARALADRSHDVEEILGARGADLLGAADARQDGDGVVRTLLAFLRTALARRPRVEPRVRGALAAVRSCRSGTVKAVADDLGVSSRHLRDLVARHVGLSPKRLARVERLHRALATTVAAEPPSWCAVAVDAGYYDQPHLIHEFQALLGENPGRFLARRQPGPGTPGLSG